ncbi:MAG: adenosylcobinamide-GDP ribazoletransferase [Lautropia sp.]|nr:adenosylcobinamide-GDP ribazoletransferase [Lautropia sp.]
MMDTLGSFLRHYLLALQFFTRLPLPARLMAWVGFSPAMMRAAAAHFPGVGWVVGGCSALALWGAWQLLSSVGAMLPLGVIPEAVQVGGAVVPLEGAVPGAAVGAPGSVAVPAASLVPLMPTYVLGCVSALLVVLLSLMASVWLTGAFHEDGLADVGDALGGFASREQALRIMKDSRLGTYGTITLLLVVSLKISLLWLLMLAAGLQATMMALLAVHVLSRWAPLWLIRWLRYVGATDVAGTGSGVRSPDPLAAADTAVASAIAASTSSSAGDVSAGASKSRPMAEDISRRALLAAGLWCLPALLLVLAAFGAGATMALCLVAVVLTWQLGLFFRRRLGGVTGDCLGATQQLVEVGCHLVLVWAVLAHLSAGLPVGSPM